MRKNVPSCYHPNFTVLLMSGVFLGLGCAFAAWITWASEGFFPEGIPRDVSRAVAWFFAKPWLSLLLGVFAGATMSCVQKRQMKHDAEFLATYYLMSRAERRTAEVRWRILRTIFPAMLGTCLAVILAMLLRVSLMVATVVAPQVMQLLTYPEAVRIYELAKKKARASNVG